MQIRYRTVLLAMKWLRIPIPEDAGRRNAWTMLPEFDRSAPVTAVRGERCFYRRFHPYHSGVTMFFYHRQQLQGIFFRHNNKLLIMAASEDGAMSDFMDLFGIPNARFSHGESWTSIIKIEDAIVTPSESFSIPFEIRA